MQYSMKVSQMKSLISARKNRLLTGERREMELASLMVVDKEQKEQSKETSTWTFFQIQI